MDGQRKLLIRIGVGFAVGIVLLLLFTQAIGWQEVLVALTLADPLLFVVALGVGLSAYLSWAMVLGNVLKMADLELPAAQVVPIFFSATFANYVTPLGQAGGEPFIAYVLSKNSDIPFERGLASVVATDLINLIPFFTISTVGIGGFLVFSQVTPLIRASLLFLLLLAVLVVLFVAFFWYERRTAERLLLAVFRPFRWLLRKAKSQWGDRLTDEFLIEKMENFYHTVETIVSQRRLLGRTLFFSALGWVLFILPIFFLSLALGTVVPLLVLFFIVPISTIGGFTPLPGGLAAIEILLTQLLVVFAGLASASAFAITILYRVVIYWVPLAIGGIITIVLTFRPDLFGRVTGARDGVGVGGGPALGANPGDDAGEEE